MPLDAAEVCLIEFSYYLNWLLSMDNKKSSYWKFVVGFVALVVLALGAFVAAKFYAQLETQQTTNKLAESLRKEIADYNARLALDTYGGKTPQETLRLYIDAVEKGDYVLASKYFIGDNQKKELKSLQNSKQENISDTVSLLKQSIQSQGSFSADGKEFVVRRPLLVDFELYPNGIWKIIEI